MQGTKAFFKGLLEKCQHAQKLLIFLNAAPLFLEINPLFLRKIVFA